MGLFNFGKKKENAISNQIATSQEKPRAVKVLGSGCAKCNELEENVIKAMKQLGMEPEVEHVRDFGVIANYGVMTTPALVVDETVVSYGKVLKVEEAVALLEKRIQK